MGLLECGGIEMSDKREHPTLLDKKKGAVNPDRQNTHWSNVIVRECEHEWQPVSFLFENEAHDPSGRLANRSPDMTDARVYCICMKCLGYTDVNAGWVGSYLGGPDELEEEE